jgi:hypothetical protein
MAAPVALFAEFLLWCVLLGLVRAGGLWGALAALLLLAAANVTALALDSSSPAAGPKLHWRWPGWWRFLAWFTPLRMYLVPAWLAAREPEDSYVTTDWEWKRRTVLRVGTGLVAIGAALLAVRLYLPQPVRARNAIAPAERLAAYCTQAIGASANLISAERKPGPPQACVCTADGFLHELRRERPEKVELALILIEDSVRFGQRIPDSHIARLWASHLESCRGD